MWVYIVAYRDELFNDDNIPIMGEYHHTKY